MVVGYFLASDSRGIRTNSSATPRWGVAGTSANTDPYICFRHRRKRNRIPHPLLLAAKSNICYTIHEVIGMKKKLWLLIPAICIPYLALFTLATLFFSAETPFFGFLMESVFQNNLFLLLGPLGFFCLLVLTVSIVYVVLSVRKGWDALTLAKYAMILKLTQVPAYVVIFVLGVLLAITIFTIPFAIGLWLLDCFTLLISGLFMLAAVVNSVRQDVFESREVCWYAILQLFFCADVVATVVFYRKLKKKYKEQE